MNTPLSRRHLLRLLSAGALTSALPRLSLSAEPAQKKPNILIILADDMGFSDIGPYGGEISTPNLDALAKNGLRFTNFYNTGRCCPTRASLLTGLYPHQAGVGHMVQDKKHPGYRGFLNNSCVTLAEALKPAGYHPLMVGKWHVGNDRPHWPVDRGFEHYHGLVSGGSNYFSLDKDRVFARDGESINPTTAPGFYMTDAFTDAAVNYIAEYAPKPDPFLLYVAYTAPHWPLHARPEDIAKYKGKYMLGWDKLREQRRQKLIDLGIINKDTPLTPRDPKAYKWDDLLPQQKEEFDLRMAVYAAQIDRMDQGIGRILDKLRETNSLDNTLILFLADNGGCAEIINRGAPGVPPGPKESFLSYGIPWANASNTPFRLYKHFVHEGGISSPLIAHLPRQIKPNTLTPEPSHLIDIMATCLDVAGASYPETFKDKPITPLEGKSLLPTLKGQPRDPHAALFWEHEGNRAVRQGNWKLVAKGPAGPWELYDLSNDRVELHNLAAAHPDKVAQLPDLYRAWAARSNVLPWRQVNANAN
jgi:arylsulfatase A-like enzyme